MGRPAAVISKHPLVHGIELHVIRNLLVRHEKSNNRLLLATAIDHLGCPAEQADSLLRRLSEAGYLEWVADQPGDQDWKLTECGLRLVADKLGPRIMREAVDAVIAKVIERARAINADRGRIARVVELRLFGSALDATRKDYGDVDVDVRFKIRRTPIEEVSQARAKISANVPQSWHSDIILRLHPEETYDRRSARTALRRGIKGLSLSEHTTDGLGCEYQTIYRFDPDTGREVAGDQVITPRTSPPAKPVIEISTPSLPARTVIRPLGLAAPDEALPTDDLRISMSDIAYDEAVAWLGQSEPGGVFRPIDATPMPRHRFAGARYLFEEWRDRSLTGLELFQRTLDWASLYDLPISRAGRTFMLRTCYNRRVANFHALVVNRVADRVEAFLALNSNPCWPQPGTSDHTTPRMIAAHHALAVAFGRMLDETRLTGQVDFRAEFDLTERHRNFWPAIPNLSHISRGLRRLLPKVRLPDHVLLEASKRRDAYEVVLPVHREVEIQAHLDEQTGNPIAFTLRSMGAEWWEPEPIEEDEAGNETYDFLPGEERLVDACIVFEKSLVEALEQLPGCRFLSIGCSASVSAHTVEKS